MKLPILNPTTMTLALLVLVCHGATIDAQQNVSTNNEHFWKVESSDSHVDENTALGVWVGVSFDSRPGLFLSDVPEREFVVFGLRYSYQVVRFGRARFFYTADLIPMAVVSDNPAEVVMIPAPGGGLREAYSSDDGGLTYGAGFSPVGFRFSIDLLDEVSIDIGASAGLLHFTQPVPTIDANRFNFSFDFGGGASVLVSKRCRIHLGYKLHHLSSAGIGEYNPGLDAYVFFLGLNRTT